MDLLRIIKRELRAKHILRSVDKYAKEHPEYSYKQCFIAVMELEGLDWTLAFKNMKE